MRKSLSFFLVVSIASLSANESTALNESRYLFGDKVRVREAADKDAKILAELQIGTQITLLAEAGEKMEMNGVEAPWYKVRFENGGKKAEGFIWGNLIAKAGAKSKGGLLFAFATSRGKKEDGYTRYISEMRVIKNGKLIAQATADEGAEFISRQKLTLQPGRGFTGVENIVKVQFEQEYCAGKGNSLFFFWTGKKLIFVHSSNDGADAPYYSTEAQLYPDEKGGSPDQLVLLRESGDSGAPKSVEKKRVVLTWKNGKLSGKK